MSRGEYQDDCVGCQPAMLDLETGQPLPLESPVMQAVLTVYGQAKRAEKVAFHNFTCNNSRRVADLVLVQGLMRRIQFALDALKDTVDPGQ